MEALRGLLRLYVWNMKLGVQRMMAYRFDFILSLLISILFSGIGPYLHYLYFIEASGYPGWTLNEILLFQGLLLLWFGIRDLLFGNIQEYVMKLIRTGDFDRLLVKPYSPIGVLLVSGFSLSSIGPCVTGIFILSMAWHRLNLIFSWKMAGLLVVMFAAGLILFLAITILFSAVTIMLIQTRGIELIINRLLGFADYPVNIFPSAISSILVTLLPIAVWTFYPAQILLDRSDSGMWIAAGSSVILFWLSLQCWKRCLYQYTSAGG